MTPPLSPRSFGRALAAFGDEQFDRRVTECRSVRHLAAAVAYERNRPEPYPTRDDRVETIVERIEVVNA